MFLTRRLAACTALTVALAVPVASANAAPPPRPSGTGQAQGSPHCPAGYSGPTNLATGCPWYVMVYDTPPASPSRA